MRKPISGVATAKSTAVAVDETLVQVDMDSLMADLEVDASRLTEGMCRIPAQIAFWNAEHAASVRSALRRKREREQMLARAWEREADPTLHGKRTQGQIKMAAELDADYQEALEREEEACHRRDVLRGVCEAMRIRADMLQSIGANLRAELRPDPSTRVKTMLEQEGSESELDASFDEI